MTIKCYIYIFITVIRNASGYKLLEKIHLSIKPYYYYYYYV